MLPFSVLTLRHMIGHSKKLYIEWLLVRSNGNNDDTIAVVPKSSGIRAKGRNKPKNSLTIILLCVSLKSITVMLMS